jgi:UDP-N-acetylmuramoyl-tripeptide--D-alanyl-D-alanine ligase
MGMRGLGQIAELCAIARPDLALVTSIGPEHLELVGTVADVARANAEAIEGLPVRGVAVVPADAPELEPFLARTDLDVRRFERSAVVRLDARDELSPEGAGARWRFEVAGGVGETDQTVELELPFDQRHMAENVLAALTLYRALGLPLDRAQEGASAIRLSRWRAEVRELDGGGVVVNDAYNANPTSMRAALLDLSERAAGRRRVAILGEMAELGAESVRYHHEIGVLLGELGIEVVVAVGEPARAYLASATGATSWIPDAASFDEVGDLVFPGDAVLVKASRAIGLEGIAALIEKRVGSWSAS